ncbi:MAG TPA: ABC transporter ATP-binding protein, partial [Flavisolibacter sp.]|nr:ABC transporter ATP-binding protein [Flavisolibacter sp.]
MLEMTDVKKFYHTRLALQVPILHLDSGIYWIKGKNGSGKTTFLKMVAGLLPFDGDILLNKVSLKKKPTQYRKQISWAEAEPMYP